MAFLRAHELDRSLMSAALQLAEIYTQKGEREKAILFYQKVLGQDPQNEKAGQALRNQNKHAL